MSQKNQLFDDQLIVITGAAGFIGSNVVRYLNDQGYSNLLLVDDFKCTQKWKNLRGKRFSDFISRYELMDFLQGREREIEAFIHLGACSDTVELDGDYFMETNYRYSIELAEYALSHGHRFIYASSAATYGDGKLGFSDDHNALESLMPLNLYGFSKHMFDMWLKEHDALNDVVGLKYFNVFGPNEWHKGRMASMGLHLTNRIEKEGNAQLFQSSEPDKYKDGEQKRDFIYVKDAAQITCSFLSNDLTGIYNVGRGEGVTWNRFANAVFSALGKEPKIDYIPMPKDLIKGYQNYTSADLTKFRAQLEKAELDPLKFHSIEEAMKDYVQNHLLPGVYA